MDDALLPVGLVISTFSVAWLLLVAVRKRYLGRLALRQFTRRPGETVLVIAGSILGTALVTGSFITGDSLTASFTDSVFRRLGEVDESVQLTTPRAVRQGERHIDDLRALELVDGAVLVDATTGVVRPEGSNAKTEPRAWVYSMDVDDLDTYGSTTQSVTGPTPASNEAIITRELADDLDLTEGDVVELLVWGREREFAVERIAEGDGFASYRDGRNLFIAPNILADLADAAGVPNGTTREIWISNAGDAREGRDLTFPVKADVTRLLDDEGVEVLELKKTFVDQAEDAATEIGQLFFVISTFAVVAGILLLVNIFVMLATERRSELGMLRAVGMKRGDLVRGFALEGSLYGGSAAVMGVFAGIGVGMAIVFIADQIFSSIDFFGDLEVNLVVQTRTLIAGLVVGFAISIVTIFFTSVRVSRVNIIAAIRDLEVRKAGRHAIRSWVLGPLGVVVGGALAAQGIAASNAIPALIGPALIGLGVWLLFDKIIPERILVSVIGIAVLAWGIIVPFFIDLFADEQEYVFVAQGLITTFAAVMVLSVNQEWVAAGVRRLGALRGGSALAARLATTYPVARRFRTGMTLVMYSLIVFTLVLITTFGYVTELNIDAIVRDESAGFQIIGTTNPSTPATSDDIEDTNGVDYAYGIARAPNTLRSLNGEEDQEFVHGVDAEFIRLTRYGLDDYDNRYKNEDEVWQAVAADPSLVIVDAFYNDDSGGPTSRLDLAIGSQVEMVDPISATSETRTIVGYNDAGMTLPGSFVSSRALERQYARAGRTAWLIASTSTDDADLVAERLSAQHVDVGLQARAIDALVRDFMAVNLQFFGLLRGYLALGLVVGIVGLGVIMVRAVRERRREIGVLRALGFRSRTVRRAFMGEAGLVAAEGIALGVALGVVTARSILTSSLGDTFEVGFAVPWSSVAILAALTFGFSVLVAVLPARAAAKIRPAIALRLAD